MKEGTKASEAAERFFKVASCSKYRIMSVGIIQSKIANQNSADANADELGSSVASSLQMQLLALYYDRLARCKSVEKFKAMLDLHLGQHWIW